MLALLAGYVQTYIMWLVVITLKMPKVQLWDQPKVSIFTYHKQISFRIVVLILFKVEGVSPKDLEPILDHRRSIHFCADGLECLFDFRLQSDTRTS